MDRDEEIGRIRQELTLLRACCASYRRAAGIMRTFFRVLIPLCAIAAAIFAAKLFLSDTLYGVFFIGVVAIFVAAAIWFVRSLDLRWIDFVSQSPRGIYSPAFFYPDVDPRSRPRSDAELIEQQIADRERRLSELGVSVPGEDRVD